MGKKDARQQILDLIEEKAQRRRDIRAGLDKDATYVQEVLRCLNNLDLLAQESENEVEMHVAMESECKRLFSRLKTFDPYMKAHVEWNDTKDWKQLRPLGIRLFWSNYFLRLNPDKEQEEYIDVSRMLLDDY